MKEKVGAALDRKSGFARNAAVFFALAMIFRGLGLVNRIETIGRYALLTEIILPIAFCAMMLLCIPLFGRRHMILSLFPMMLFVLFLVIRSTSADNLLGREPGHAESLIRMSAALLLFVLYSFTVQTNYRFKWILIPALLF